MTSEQETQVIEATQELAHRLDELCDPIEDYIEALEIAIDDLQTRKEAAELDLEDANSCP